MSSPRDGSRSMAMRAAASFVLAIAPVRLWRSRVPFDLKAAAFAAGTLLVTPYVYTYDLVVHAVAVDFFFAMLSIKDS